MLPAHVVEDAEVLQERITEWFGHNGRVFPWRLTQDPFKILVAEVVLRLTGAWKAQRVYEHLVELYGTPHLLAEASMSGLREAFAELGLFSRAELLVNIARELTGCFNGIVPKTYAELVSIKGVGQYTANAILCLGYGERVPLVDGSVSRVFRRCFAYTAEKEAYADKELWTMALELLPARGYREYNLGLLDLGALVCRHRKPLCDTCPIAEICVDLGLRSKLVTSGGFDDGSC